MAKQAKMFTRWTPEEYLRVAANALPFIDANASSELAFYKAQKLCLLDDRWQPTDLLHKWGSRKVQATYVMKARALSPKELVKLQVPAAFTKAGSMKLAPQAAAPSEPVPAPVAAPAEERLPVPTGEGKGRNAPRPRIKWTPHMDALVAREVQRLQGMSRSKKAGLPTLFDIAQRKLLPETSWRTHKTFVGEQTRGILQATFQRGLSQWPQFAGKPIPWAPAPAEPPAAAPAPEPTPAAIEAAPVATPTSTLIPISKIPDKPFPARAARFTVAWTTLDKAKLAKAFDSIDPEGASVSTVLFKAQQLALLPDRWRVRQSLHDLHYRKGIDPILEEGRLNLWLLDPPKVEAPAPAPEPAPAPDSFVPPALDGANPELVATWKAEFQNFKATEKAQGAASTLPAPIPFPVSSGGLVEATAAFAATMSAAVGQLLQASAAHTLSALDAKLASIAQAAGQTIAAQIATQIERGLRQTVLDTMAAELGGPVKAPYPDLSPASAQQGVSPSFPERPQEDPPPGPSVPSEVNSWQAKQAAALLAEIKPPRESEPRGTIDLPEAEPRPKVLKIDVVGFNTPDLEQRVRREFKNPDFRFYTPDDYQHFSPHKSRHCVMMIDRVPHAIKYKLSAAKVKPILVKGTVGHVIHAIDELHRSKGIPL